MVPKTPQVESRSKLQVVPRGKLWLIRLVMGVTGLVIGVLLTEAALRLVFSLGVVPPPKREDSESAWRLRWINRHRSKLDIVSTPYLYDPTRGWALKPGVRNLQVYDGKILNTNSRGLRGTTEYAYEKAPGRKRIIVLGDSFTFGVEVSDEETYSSYLHRFLPGVDVLNLGVTAYGHDQILLYLREEGIRYHPDIVILGFVYADIPRNMLAFRDFAKPRYALEGGRLVLRNSPVPSPESVLRSEVYRPKLLDILAILHSHIRWRPGEARREAGQVTYAILEEMARTIKGSGAIPLFVYLPEGREIVRGPAGPTQGEVFMFRFCQERSVPCFSLRPAFMRESQKGVKLTLGLHWSPEGHLTAASLIRDYLVRNNLVGIGRQ